MRRRRLLAGSGALALVGAGAAYSFHRGTGSMRDYDTAVAATRTGLAVSAELRDVIRAATLAPSGHNAQPWRFRINANGIDVLPDFSRRTPVVDPDDHHLFVSLGCAAENLALAAGARGLLGELRFQAPDDGCVSLTLGSGTAVDPALFDAIPMRQSTRAEYDGRQIEPAVMRKLAAAGAEAGVDLVLVADRPGIDAVRDLVVEGDSAQMAESAFIRELKAWLRFSPREAMRTGDGLFTAASGNPVLPEWLGRRAFDWTFRVGAENDRYARQLRSSSAIAVFVSEHADHDHWVRVGRACQRFALQATALGLKHSFVNQPVEVASLRPELARLIGLPDRRPDIVMRFGYGPDLPFSARRPVSAVTSS